MAISQTAVHALRVLLQIEQNITGLQRDMVFNANSWIAMANAGNPPVTEVAGFMIHAGVSYQVRLEWLRDYRDNSPNWDSVRSMYVALGGVGADMTNLYSQLRAVANALQSAPIATYQNVIDACNQILATVQSPDSLWPE